MKRNVFGALMTLIVAIAIAAPMVQAQSQTIMKAEVPFGFNVGSTYMPAGSYEVRALGARATVIETKDGHNRVLTMFNPAGPSKAVDETKLVFQKYGDRYVLAQIWTSTSGQGLEAPKSDLEKESKLASNGTQGGGETVIVACANRPQPSHEARSPHRLRVFILGSSHLSPLSPSGIPAM